MFNWLKNKLINNVVPSDIKRGFMSCNFCTIKLGTKVIVPENLVCFVYFKDKFYLELPAGEHYLDEKNLKSLCIKQHGTTKAKKVKVDFFFVNCAELDRNIKFKNTISVLNRFEKVAIKARFTIKVCNAKLFNEIIQGEMSYVNAEKTDGVVEGFFEDVLRKLFLKKKFHSFNIDESTKSELDEKVKKACLDFGLHLIKMEISVENLKVTNTTKVSFESKKENVKSIEKVTKTIDAPKENVYTNSQPTSQTSSANQQVCPVCKSKLISHSWYCHRCGYKVKK